MITTQISSPLDILRRGAPSSRATTPLPASVSSNITKAVFRLLRDEDEIQEKFGESNFSETRHLPRLDNESLAERNFRIAVAQQICSLIRGYQECLFFVSANQPVFNRDRFLRQAPALFEVRGGGTKSSSPRSRAETSSHRMLSPRSKRFLSGLVNTQHFHDLLERLDNEETSFFHHVMESFQSETDSDLGDSSSQVHIFGSEQQKQTALELSKSLDNMEENISTYHVYRYSNRRRSKNIEKIYDEDDDMYLNNNDGYMSSFTSKLLKKVEPQQSDEESLDAKNKMSLQQLMELEKRPWEYCKLFDIELKMQSETESDDVRWSKIQLKEALGDRKFRYVFMLSILKEHNLHFQLKQFTQTFDRAWQYEEEKKEFGTDDILKGGQNLVDSKSQKNELDLMKLIPAVYEEEKDSSNFSPNVKQSEGNIGDERDVVREYIEKAYELVQMGQDCTKDKIDNFISNGSTKRVRVALQKPSAQRFLVSVLSQRGGFYMLPQDNFSNATLLIFSDVSFPAQLQNQRRLSIDRNNEDSLSRLQPIVFECLVNLCNTMLDACMKDYDYESAYRLLTHTTGFCTTAADDTCKETSDVSFMTKRVGMHLIYSDLRLWERVVLLHKRNRQKDRTGGSDRFSQTETVDNDEYEATVSTLYEMLGYGMPANDLAKFASRIATEKFFSTDKEQKIMVLARKLALKCDDTDTARDSILFQNKVISDDTESSPKVLLTDNETKTQWEEICWSHPSSSNALGESSRGEKIEGQSPVTALASFGSSVVASGALDGSVFLAHTFNIERNGGWNSMSDLDKSPTGVRLSWHKNNSNGSSSLTSDENVGAVSCLVASSGTNQSARPNAFDLDKDSDKETILGAVAGCRIVAGTTGGDIRVWSLHDVFQNELLQDSEDISSVISETYSTSQSHIRKRPIAKLSRRGRSIGGHRGGVTCFSVPAQIYRPDSLISGGNDGLIKQWSLQHQTSEQNRRASMGGRTSRMLFSGRENSNKGMEAVNVLAGHGGRILCLDTAWHCDKLLSGAGDFTMKLWDLAGSGNQCIQTMIGHSG